MATITADLVINKNLFAKSKVEGFDYTFQNVIKVFNPGDLIGNVFSYINRPDGLYWMVYLSQADFNTFNPTYIKHDRSKISLPELPQILEQISIEQEKKLITQKGLFQYNIDKYAPWLIGALVLTISLPTITDLFKTKK